MKNTKVTLVPLTADDREQFILDNRTEHYQESREPSRAREHVKEEAHSDTEDERPYDTEAKAFNRTCHLHAQVKLF